jgi:hypothetical protein
MMSLKAVGKENTFTNTTDNKKSLFAKSNKKYCADCSAYIKVIVEIDESSRTKCEENLVDLFGFLYNPDLPDAFVIGTFISYDSYIRDYKTYSDTLIDDLTKKCREDANRVVEGLGFKISGVSKISFNNTAVSNAKVKYSEDYTSQRSFTSKGYMDDDGCSFDLDESFSDDNAFGSTDVVKADANTVSSLVNKQYTLSLDIDVVFKVE